MSRRKIKNNHTREKRKMKSYLFRKKWMDDKNWQEWCRKQARKEAQLKRAKEDEESKNEEPDLQ